MAKHTKREIKDAAKQAFLQTHEGRSTDDVVIDDRLNHGFLQAAAAILPNVLHREFNWELLNLRKSGKLGRVTSIRGPQFDREDYLHAVEIAARYMEDRYDTTVDRLICDTDARREFDQLASSIAPGYPTYAYRKAALDLRKSGQLRPELLKRIMQSGTTAVLVSAETITANPEAVPRLPGIYIFADDSGPLYIGESEDLRSRVLKHLDHSDRKSLAHYLWEKGITKIKVQTIAFPVGQLGAIAKNRKALEASLIASRRPRFNIQYTPDE